ncbi:MULTISPECIES: porin family protein [unclassified Carboxylicivirga]|uniref:porin family protein n=1 Tax=Carboxylicivirga TaxID=1628153 RepID=UPI003D329A82
MKKIIFCLTLIALAAGASAQDRIALGLKAGFNSTKINLSDVPDNTTIKNEAKSGFLFGAYGRIRLVGSLSFQPEMYYAKKKSNANGMIGDNSFNNNVTYHTWDIPLLANLQLIDLKILKIYGVAGPVASFNAKTTSDLPTLEDLDKTNWTLQAGLGAEVWRLTADFRYEWGIKDISKAQVGQKTDVLTFSLGYKLFGI